MTLVWKIAFAIAAVHSIAGAQAQSVRTPSSDTAESLFLQDRLDAWPSLWTNSTPADFESSYRRALERYGYVGWLIAKKNTAAAESALEVLESELESLFRKQPRSARLWALRAAVSGFRIGLQPWRAIELGPSSLEAIETALRLDANEPIARIESANALRYRPAIFGGSVEAAAREYRDALALPTAQERLPKWLIWSTKLAIAECWEETGNGANALQAYRSLLEEEPTFAYLRTVALPRAEKKFR